MPPVYGVFGHGCDILEEEEYFFTVPPGCVYVTFALCGFLSIDLQKLMYAFEDRSIWESLEDPEKHIEKLLKYFGTTADTDIHVHEAGESYVDSYNTLIYDSDNHMYKSGLYKLGDFTPANKDAVLEDRYYLEEPYSPADIETLYRGSLIQPKIAAYETNGAFARKNKIGVRMSDLFNRGPGVYYNFSCRPICNEKLQYLAGHRRQWSKERQRPEMMEDLGTGTVEEQMSLISRIAPREVFHSGQHSYFEEWLLTKLYAKRMTKRKSKRRSKRVQSRVPKTKYTLKNKV